ncbi:protein FAR1-RELATED SEQUENCE 5-like [Olea europaea var. sylvestris]|uniref:protein FAR1-RELATED SEQUENCE 5-like n=1 Tax=Olea europaea var. sylvestris TaxID=158386 RepID=UPI000C1D7E8E|nr:protein FAR1-RELATED SEQUENCE 5-like [Olea europaea var. sylvestris]
MVTENGDESSQGIDDITLVESDNENVMEEPNLLGGDEIVGGDGAIVPEVGMKFKHEKELFDFYKRYAYKVGFLVRTRNSKKDDDGVVRYITLTCSREGKRSSTTVGSLRPQATIQTSCKVRTSPTKSRLYRCNRELSAQVKRLLEVNDIAGILLHKSYNSAVVEAGGYENVTFVEKDCRHYVEQVRRLRLGEGDAVAIQSYFSKMQASCSGFYFSIDLDDESRLRNVFWADNRSRQAYKEFGDVVTFDTTYFD